MPSAVGIPPHAYGPHPITPTLHPPPYTPHAIPSTPIPSPKTIYPPPYTPHPTPPTLIPPRLYPPPYNPQPYNPHLIPSTLHPPPYTPHPMPSADPSCWATTKSNIHAFLKGRKGRKSKDLITRLSYCKSWNEPLTETETPGPHTLNSDFSVQVRWMSPQMLSRRETDCGCSLLERGRGEIWCGVDNVTCAVTP